MNIDHLDTLLDMAERIGADYVELANTQYYSWAHVNRDTLLPSRAQLEQAERTTQRWRAKLQDRMKLFFVVPDYFETRPKRCMNGWGTTFMTVTPDGTALPCHTARMLPGLVFPNVHATSVAAAWYDSDGFNRFRGTGWMKEPCASCDEREKDFGGCRCQAFLLADDPYAADPVCDKSPHHALVTEPVERAQRPGPREFPLVFRDPAKSRSFA